MSKVTPSPTATLVSPSVLPLPEKSPKRYQATSRNDESDNLIAVRKPKARYAVQKDKSDALRYASLIARGKGKTVSNSDRDAFNEENLEFSDTNLKALDYEQRENKPRSLYFDDVYGYRDPIPARELVASEVMVFADIKTNVIVEDELLQMNDISLLLSRRYQRPESCIAVDLSHSSCIVFRASWAPSYTLTISTISSLLQPTTNKRNAVLIGKRLQDILGVAPERGLILFRPIQEENFARGGRTVAGEIDELEKELNEDTSRSSVRSSPRSSRKKPSLKSLKNGKNGVTVKFNDDIQPVAEEPADRSLSSNFKDNERAKSSLKGSDQKVSRRKSFYNAVFGKSSK